MHRTLSEELAKVEQDLRRYAEVGAPQATVEALADRVGKIRKRAEKAECRRNQERTKRSQSYA